MIKLLKIIERNGIMFLSGILFLLGAIGINSVGKEIVWGVICAVAGNMAEMYLEKHKKA